MGAAQDHNHDHGIDRFILIAAVIAAVLSALPQVIGYLLAPAGTTYLGHQFNTDDHMVYSAWMRQAMDGRITFENRFAIDPQPGLTIHLYFLVLGWIAKLTGLPLAALIGKICGSFVFVRLLGNLLKRLKRSHDFVKFSLALTVFGAGFGYLVWHQFGNVITKPVTPALVAALGGNLPTDVWQPEGFVFPSMLTNGLFMASLCLFLGVIISAFDCRTQPKRVIVGALCALVLMNIHSYDVLILALVFLAWLAAQVATKQVDWKWVGRILLIALGAVPSALWFAYVLGNDPVFQARAATETYSPHFRQILFGYLPLIGLAALGLAWRLRSTVDKARLAIATVLVAAVSAWMFFGPPTDGYAVSASTWSVAFLTTVAVVVLAARPSAEHCLFLAWAVVGLVLPYFPALFQRKLAMGLSIPWAIVASLIFFPILEWREAGTRKLVSALVILLAGGSSVLWLSREFGFIRNNVSRTTLHSVYLTRETSDLISELNRIPGRKVVLAMPGIPQPGIEPDQNFTPYVPDLNAIITGLTGAFTYAGHWSETPNYVERRNSATRFFLARTDSETRQTILRESQASYAIAPVPAAFTELKDAMQLIEPSELGEVIGGGRQFALVKLRN